MAPTMPPKWEVTRELTISGERRDLPSPSLPN
ncbi:MAG: hypothetical protein QOF29_2306, partial [bacterium]